MTPRMSAVMLLAGVAPLRAQLCDPTALPTPAPTPTPDPLESQQSFNDAVTHVMTTYAPNGTDQAAVQAALLDANEGFGLLVTIPTYFSAASVYSSSCTIVAARDMYNESGLLYQVLFMTNPVIAAAMLPLGLDPGLPPLMATTLNLASTAADAIPLATFTAAAEQALLLETFTAKFVALAPTADPTDISNAVYLCLLDLVEAATALTPGLEAAALGDTRTLVTEAAALYATDPRLYQIIFHFTPLDSYGIPDLSLLLPSTIDPGYPPELAAAMGVAEGADITAGFGQVVLVLDLTTKFALLAPDADATEIQTAVTICAAELVDAITALTAGLEAAAAGDTRTMVTESLALYTTNPRYYAIVFHFTPLDDYGIPDLSGLLPEQIHPGYPDEIAVAMGVPEEAVGAVDISAGFGQVLLVIDFTAQYYTLACCPWPMNTTSDECLVALATCTISSAEVQAAVSHETEGLGVLVEAATAFQPGLIAASENDTLFFISEASRIYDEKPILYQVLYAYTPLPSYGTARIVAIAGIPKISELVPALNPGLPLPLAEAMGIPENASAIRHFCMDQTDCIYGGGLRQVCADGFTPGGVCSCPFSFAQVYPFCIHTEPKAVLAVVMYTTYIVMYAVVFFTFLYVGIVRYKSEKARGPITRSFFFNFFTTTVAWALIGSSVLAGKYAYNIDETVNAHKYPKYYLMQVDDGVLLVVSAMFLPLCTINVSMMWIEFGLASKRMASMSSNLKLTKNIIVGYIVFFIVCSSIFLYITVGPPVDPPEPVDSDFQYATRGLFMINAWLTTATYFYGGAKMYFTFARHAEAEKTNITQGNTMRTSSQTATEDSINESAHSGEEKDDSFAKARAEEEQQKMEAMDEQLRQSEKNLKMLMTKARMIAETAVFVGGCCFGIGWTLLGTIMFPEVDEYEAQWINLLLLHIFMAGAELCVARFLLFMMKPDKHIARVSKKFKINQVTPAEEKYAPAPPAEPAKPAAGEGSHKNRVGPITTEEDLKPADVQ